MNLSKKIFVTIFSSVLLIIFSYLIVFNAALTQNENHLGITLVMPKVLLFSNIARVDQKTYLTTKADAFIEEMKKQGFTHIDQLGSLYIFTKDNKRHHSFSRQYSSHFMLFSYPVAD